MGYDKYSEITPYISSLADLARGEGAISANLYEKYKVNRGLRDLNGKGVLTGLTEISEVKSSEERDGVSVPCEGKLYYRGYDVNDLVRGFTGDGRFGYEECVYLLLFGVLPNKKELDDFTAHIESLRTLPSSFVRDIILKAPSRDMMNSLARSVLTLYSYDENADDTSVENVLRQSLQLISLFPMLSVYSYQSYSHYHDGQSLFIHTPAPGLSTAENLLHILRIDSKYTDLEARVLDMALVLHAEHGGGNNSTFTNHVVTSSGTDTYSAVAASLGSLKGPKHGGANRMVTEMFEDIKAHVPDWNDENALRAYLDSILAGEAFNHTGLIYGMGHAIYSVSDPRARIFKQFVEELAHEKGMEAEYKLHTDVERIAAELIARERNIYKGVSANVDFYSGFVYSMLGIPTALFTPLFAVARLAGWSAHRLEELIGGGKIIRPAYMAVHERVPYTMLSDR